MVQEIHRRIRTAAAAVAAVILVAVLLNIPVSTRQGVDYSLTTRKIPFYLKALDFLDRHYNYGILAKRITGGEKTQEGKSLKLLKWVKQNLKENPPSLPVIDDHVWHIIIRGYGTNDQFQDVFSTLCNYAGIEAFFGRIVSKDKRSAKLLSFARFRGGWTVFDAYDGVYFRNGTGSIACGADFEKGDWMPVSVTGGRIAYDYGPLFDNISSVHFREWKRSRSAIQSPLRRFCDWLGGGRKGAESEGD